MVPGAVPEASGAAKVYEGARLHFYFLSSLAGWYAIALLFFMRVRDCTFIFWLAWLAGWPGWLAGLAALAGWPGCRGEMVPGVVPEASGSARGHDGSRLHFYFLAGLVGWPAWLAGVACQPGATRVQMVPGVVPEASGAARVHEGFANIFLFSGWPGWLAWLAGC